MLGQCASGSAIICEWKCASEHEICECEYGDVRVETWEWSGNNVRVNMECASASTVMCE